MGEDKEQIVMPGEKLGIIEQYVPGEIVTYKETFACKKCGHKTYKTHTKSIPNVY